MAKDVRHFVQSFNMSRQFSDQNRGGETLEPVPDESSTGQFPINPQKRTDWTEYIDPEEICLSEEEKDLLSSLNTLSAFYTENSSNDRRNLRSTIEKRALFINQEFLQASDAAQQALDSVEKEVNALAECCEKIAKTLNSCSSRTADIISTTERLKHELEITTQRQEIVSCFLLDYQLSIEEVYIHSYFYLYCEIAIFTVCCKRQTFTLYMIFFDKYSPLRFYLVSRGYSANCGRKHCWACMSCRYNKNAIKNGKRPLVIHLEDDESSTDKLPVLLEDDLSMAPVHQSESDDHRMRRSGKRPLVIEIEEDEHCANKLPKLLENDQSDDHEHQDGNDPDSDPLTNGILRDNLISSLIRCSRSDYGSIASVNQEFRSFK